VVSKETSRLDKHKHMDSLERTDLYLSYKGVTTGRFRHRPTAVAYY
jgi:hypothetical protein